MELKKAKTAAIAVTVAAAITLSGTFAWQSISPMALNEAMEPTNPGGRLHDDFSGYGPNDTKDIYVENFGNEPIYARIRLDEYMEIGEGAGLKGTANPDGTITPNPDNHAVSLVPTAKINDMTTWTTHIPGDSAAETGAGTETGFADSSKNFHTYWTWYMGGQAADNAEGKTVYMPTFNKNKDSLKSDVNGTLAGTNPTDDIHYDDYKPYTVGETADRVRDTNTTTYPDGAAYDADADTTDECGPYGGAGGSGVAGVNYEMKEETHKAQETMGASVITMAEYKDKTDAQKADFVGWVYDVDGWAYWSQPIAPGTPTDTDKFITNATGVLLDRIVLEHKPSEAWYYGINAVGQFITADDLGRSDDPQSGFYDPNGGKKPTNDALDLLEGIGVNTAAVKGSIVPSASVTADGTVKHLSYVVQGMNIDLAAVVSVTGVSHPDQAVTWTLSGNTDTNTTLNGTTLTIGPDEHGPLTLVAQSSRYDRLKGKLILPIHDLAYTVTVTPDGNAAGVLPGATQGFTAVLSRNDFQPVDAADQAFTWELDASGVTYKTGTAVTVNATDASKATLTVAGNETGTVTVKATPTNAPYSSVSGTASIPVNDDVTYTVNIKDSGMSVVTSTTVEIAIGYSADFTLDVTSTPTGARPTDNWTWTSSDTSKATVSGAGTSVTVNIPAGVALGQTATITATNNDYSPALTASFTVKTREPVPADVPEGGTVKVDGVEYIVLLKDVTVNGKASGETSPTNHKAALLLSKDMYVSNTTFGSSNKWNASTIRTTLNGDYLTAYPTVADKAIEVELYTRGDFNDATDANKQTTTDKVFLLSEADVFGTSNYGDDTSPQSWEFTYNNAKIPYFTDDTKRAASTYWWLRSPGNAEGYIAYVHTDGALLCSRVDAFCGVRPAFWYNLDP